MTSRIPYYLNTNTKEKAWPAFTVELSENKKEFRIVSVYAESVGDWKSLGDWVRFPCGENITIDWFFERFLSELYMTAYNQAKLDLLNFMGIK